jgi:hypothetical protein
MTDNTFYVYAHHKPGDDIPFNIGKGTGRRAWKKERAYNPRWKNIVNKYGFEVRIVAEHLTEDQALWLEVHQIAAWGRADQGKGPLVNLTDGGEGRSGHIPSKETLEKRSISMKGKNIWMKGRKAKEETKEKITKALTGRECKQCTKDLIGKKNLGSRRTMASRKLMSEKATGKVPSLANIEKRRKSMIGKNVGKKRTEKEKKAKSEQVRGSRWVCDPASLKTRLLPRGVDIPDGWVLGRRK